MAQKLNSMPSYTARFPKESHDMSQSLTLTAATGMELPVYYDVVHPGDSYHFTARLFARMNPLIKPALGDIDFHLDYFFVPLQVLYTPSSSLQWDTDDLISSLIDKNSLRDKFPLFSVNQTTYEMKMHETLDPQGNPIPWQSEMSAFYPDSHFDCKGKAYFRLLDLLGYNPLGVVTDQTAQLIPAEGCNPNVFPDKLAAYHAIHELYEGFRNSDREPKSYCYQLDQYYNYASTFHDKRLLELRYSYAYKDYFSSIKVSPIASSVSMLTLKDAGGTNVTPTDYLRQIDNYLNTTAISVARPDLSISANFENMTQVKGYGTGSSSPQFGTGTIRSMFALEKLLRVIGRSEKDYESQVLAHFGFKTPHDPFHNITHIGHDMGTLHPTSVISSANTFDAVSGTGSALGEIGGQGVLAFSGQKKNFVAPCHGVLMIIMRAIPRYRYIGGFDKQNSITDRMSYFQPEFMDLGMQPLFSYEAFAAFDAFGGSGQGNHGQTRAGWQFNKEQYKRKYDRATYAFKIPYNPQVVNQYSPWVIQKNPWNRNGAINANFTNYPLSFYEFLCTPKDLNGIMEVPYDTNWNTSYLTAPHMMYQYDPFICDFNCHCKKVNIAPEYGEPEL